MSRAKIGIARFFLSISFTIGLLACTPAKTTLLPMQTPDPIRVLALGDSYTIGTGVAFTENWPNQLVNQLHIQGFDIEAPRVIAQNGWTTGDLAAGIERADPETLKVPYDLVTLLIGINNQYRGYGIEEYQLEFRTLLDEAIQFAGGDPGNVIVLSIPDWGVTPFAEGRDSQEIARQIDEFNNRNRSESQSAGAHYVEVTEISRMAANDPSLLAPDDLHPSPKMYTQWVDVVVPVVIEILSD